MAFETEGILYKVFDTESKTASFQAREFVIKSEGEYPQMIKFQLTQDKCDIIEKFETGQKIKVHFDLRGREWNEKFFTNLNAWRIESATVDESNGSSSPEGEGGKAFSPLDESFESIGTNDEMSAEDFSDLPF